MPNPPPEPASRRSAEPPSPTAEPLIQKGLAPVLARNIAKQQARRRQEEAEAPWTHKLADAITRFAGSMPFVAVHLAVLVFWLLANSRLMPGVPKFDKGFFYLGTSASVEAIFLSTFVLISQNRSSEQADRRADLDLQINLLTEHEVTRLIALTQAIGEKLGVAAADDPDLPELSRDIAPETVVEGMDEVEQREKTLGKVKT